MVKFKHNQELYKVSVSTGKMQTWEGWVDSDEVCSRYGQLDGKKQTSKYQAVPKNVGRSNETTCFEQAEVELQALYEDAISNKHYRTTKEEAEKVAKANLQPRKVTNYKDRYDKMPSTLLSSVKENGSRACVLKGQLYSKIGRPEDIKVEHLRLAVEKLHSYGLATFDAEVFAFGLPLQRIRSAWLKPIKTDKEIVKIAKDRAKKKGELFPSKCPILACEYLGYNPNEDAPKLKFHIFDIPDTTGKPFTERVVDMETLQLQLNGIVCSGEIRDCIEFLHPVVTNSHQEREEMLAEVYNEGHEGLVHYEPDGIYEFGKRSTNTAKAKPRLDGEALVIGIEKCKNGEGKLLLRCSDSLDNVEFSAMMKGTHESRMYSVQEQFIGKWVNFKYEELSEAGKPTKGVVEETRLCDFEGNPLD